MLQIKVTPGAANNQIVDWTDGVLRLRIKGIPEKGQVNEELLAFLAKRLGIAKSRIEMVSGKTSRIKRLKVDGFNREQLEERLQP